MGTVNIGCSARSSIERKGSIFADWVSVFSTASRQILRKPIRTGTQTEIAGPTRASFRKDKSQPFARFLFKYRSRSLSHLLPGSWCRMLTCVLQQIYRPFTSYPASSAHLHKSTQRKTALKPRRRTPSARLKKQHLGPVKLPPLRRNCSMTHPHRPFNSRRQTPHPRHRFSAPRHRRHPHLAYPIKPRNHLPPSTKHFHLQLVSQLATRQLLHHHSITTPSSPPHPPKTPV